MVEGGGKEVLSSEELYNLKATYLPEPFFSDLSYDVLRTILDNRDASLSITESILAKYNWDQFRIGKLYDYFQNHEDLQLSSSQKAWIIQWCSSKVREVNFKEAIKKTGNTTYEISMNAIYIWYFFQKFYFELPQSVLLDMLSFVFHDIGIEYLEQHLSKDLITDRILTNLDEGIEIDYILQNHFDFLMRHKMFDGLEYALEEIVHRSYDKYDDIRRLLLEYISLAPGGFTKLEEILDNLTDPFVWDVLEILVNIQSKFAFKFLKNKLNNGSESEKLKSSEFLIRFHNIEALQFYINYIMEQDELSRNFLESSPLRFLETSESIPLLVHLLKIAFDKESRVSEDSRSLKQITLNAFESLALKSDSLFHDVQDNIYEFISNYSSIYSDINWLHYFLDQLERKFYVNKSAQIDIEIVISKLEPLGIAP